jgi:hypothetical protein
MLPQEGAAFFRMALITGVVDRRLEQLPWPEGTMRVVAVAAGHLLLVDRVAGQPLYLSALRLVAGKADIGLGKLAQHPVLPGMYLMAGGTGDVGKLVLAPGPVDPLAVLMALQTGSILLGDRSR